SDDSSIDAQDTYCGGTLLVISSIFRAPLRVSITPHKFCNITFKCFFKSFHVSERGQLRETLLPLLLDDDTKNCQISVKEKKNCSKVDITRETYLSNNKYIIIVRL